MKLNKFLAPNIAIALVLSALWFAGVDSVFKTSDDRETNIRKYVQVQRQILDNYVNDVSLNALYKSSIKGMVSGLSDSTAEISGTPIDTTFGDVNVKGLLETKNKFEAVYNYVGETFPEEDMNARTEDAIRGMFKILDPHSIYIEPKRSQAIEENFEGKFQGIGVQFNIIQDTITVVSPIAGGPSDRLGIRSGDRIIAIEDSSAIGFANEDVRSALRGPKGSEVDVTIKRPASSKTLDFTIIRDDIPLYTVDTNYMIDRNTGYVKINRFAATTHSEFMESMRELENQGMEQIILDLRGNPGGYLSQAIAISGEFFERNTDIVSTKSRHLRFTELYRSRRSGEYKDMPVIVLVNEGSASASEIVSGAIQDHDRGIIVGQRTFGKGLVQQQYSLQDSSNIRVTISKYYTPSGRLIQKPYSKSGSEEYAYEILNREENTRTDIQEYISHVPDSLKFNTDAGRTVYGGGGIVPDHIVQQDTSQSAAVVGLMRQQRVAFNYIRSYLDNNGDSFRARWENNYNEFRKEFAWAQDDYQKVFSELKKNNLAVSDTVSTPDFNNDKLVIPNGHFEEVQWMVGGILKAELANQVWGLKKYYPVINDVFDNAIETSMKFWGEAGKYANHNVDPANQVRFDNPPKLN